ncbi:helix-turn-helix domain-containing protein [Ideonella sp. A 288]|uniref:helix-turn-helix domain-containing protein n=1 Tax=Ideonella sp. A 288 TaxID=1962181 RepID=UPI000B4BD88E|nr:helix-turn-helix domain-containing protein [Ideonella sp. A 288]
MPSRTPANDPSTPDAAPGAPEKLSIDALASLAGVTPRTVRFYIAEGLLDRPLGEKRGAHYGRRHLEQLLLVRRWTDAGLSLDRVRELVAGAPEDPPPRAAAPGSVQVWSRVTVADGLEVHLEPGRAGLSPEQLRALVRGITALYRQVRAAPNAPASASDASGESPWLRENDDEG